MGLHSGLAAWRAHRRALAWLSVGLGLFGPALGREGFDLSYPLIRLCFELLTSPMMDMPASQLALVAAVWGLCWAVYAAFVFLAATILFVLVAALAGGSTAS